MRPKGVKLDWSLDAKPDELVALTDQLIEESRRGYDKIGAVKDEDVNYENVYKAFHNVECECMTRALCLSFPQQAAQCEQVRETSAECEKKLKAFDVEIGSRQDIFNKLLILQKNPEGLDTSAKHCLNKMIKKGKKNGLHLPENLQKELKTLKSEISDLTIEFGKNLAQNKTTLDFTEEELNGTSQDFLKSLGKSTDTGKLQVTMKYPHLFPIMNKCKNPETRRRMELAFNTRCIVENTKILNKLAQLRQKLAELLGHPTHASATTQLLMSKSAENVNKFLTELAVKFQPLWQEERKYMLELKEKECKDLGLEWDGKLNSWDLRYYVTKVEEIKYSVDQDKLREYFPIEVVMKGMFEIYQEMLGMKFTEIKKAEKWHEDVQMFSVEDSNSGELMGYFFLDLYPREGKFSHAALFEIQPTYLLPDGSRQLPVSAVLTNFTKPTDTKPALLDHEELVTLFHEFGHVMHYTCAHVDNIQNWIDYMERDFIEAPSQMLENWCWEPSSLRRMSAHYKDGSPLPDELRTSLIKSRVANSGYLTLRQISLSTFDQRLHSLGKVTDVDCKKLYDDVVLEIVGIPQPKETNFVAGFDHLASMRYDAMYYSYLWSEVFSMDMFFTCFKKGDSIDSTVGMQYREKVLTPGGSKDACDLLFDFLGREPNEEAFLISRGLKVN